MAGPWIKYGGTPAPQAQQPGVMTVGTQRPKQPSPQTPAQEQSDQLTVDEKEYKLRSQPTYDRLNGIDKVRDGYRMDKRVLKYESAIPIYISGLQSAGDPAGDLLLINAFSKVNDPDTGVQQREGDQAAAAQPATEQLKAQLLKQFGSDGYGNFTPEGRKKMREAMTVRMRQLADQYRLARSEYTSYIKNLNIPDADPDTIIGPFAGLPFQRAEEAYLGRKPGLNVPIGPDGKARPGYDQIDFSGQDQPVNPLTPEQKAAYDAFTKANPKASAEQISNFFGAMGLGVRNVADVAGDASRGLGFAPAADVQLEPDMEAVGQQLQDHGGAGAAGAIGALDTAMLGTSDEVVAAARSLGGSLTGQGSFGDLYNQNIVNEREYRDRLRSNHPVASVAGNVAGGFALPMFGANSLRGLAATGAAYGGAYGAGSGEGGFAPRATNALLGAGGGAATAGALGLAAPLAGKAVTAGARKMFGPVSDEGRAVLQAGAAEGVPVNMSDIYPTARNTVATLETIPGASGPVRQGLSAGADAMEARTKALGAGGTPREAGPMGERAYRAGERYVAEHRKTSDAAYGLAEKLGGSVKAPPTKAANAVRSIIGDLSETANTNKTTLGLYKDVLGDLLDSSGNLKPLSINAIRRLRKNIRREMNNRGMIGSAEDRELQSIVDAASEDMFDALAAHNPRAAAAYKRADEGYTQRMAYINGTLKQFMGTPDKPISGEALMAKIRGMAGSGARGNSRQLNAFLHSLTSEEKADVAATFAEGLGRKSAEEAFSPSTFLTNIRNIDERSRIVLFGRSGARSIQNLIRLAEAKKGTVQRLNNSRSGQVSNYRTVFASVLFGLPGGGAMLGAATSLNAGTGAIGGTAIAGAGIGVSRAMAKALMNEEFTRAVAQAPATSSPRAIDAHIGLLRRIGAKDPNVRSVVESLEKRLLEAANDNVTKRAAASDTDQRADDDK